MKYLKNCALDMMKTDTIGWCMTMPIRRPTQDTIEHWRSLVIVAKPLQPTNGSPSCRPQISGRAESWVIVDLDFMASTHESSLKLWTILAPRLADPSTTRTAIGWFWGPGNAAGLDFAMYTSRGEQGRIFVIGKQILNRSRKNIWSLFRERRGKYI